ncbi:MAG: OmpA family protein [Roseovarius sp.]
MRLSSIFATVGIFLVAAVLSLFCARVAADVIEETSRNAVRDTLDRQGMTWTDVDADGLQVFLAGTAPSEAQRFKALSVAGTVVDAARVIDQMVVAEHERIPPPRFAMEILRNESGVSLIGLVPAEMDRKGFVAAVAKAASGAPVADLLEVADYPMPETWPQVTAQALRALKELPRTKISLDARRIAVTAMTDSASEKADVEARLARYLPEGLTQDLDISAPRPVIAPFALRFVIEDGKARFDACSADTEAARERILAAARAAGLSGQANCLIGLGVPSPRWAEVAQEAIAALAELGGGSVTLTNADISLLAAPGTPQERFDDVVGALQGALPDAFALHAVLPAPPSESAQEAPEFIATLSPEGLVQLRGRVAAGDRELIDSFARARFSSEGVHMAARPAENLPEDWTYRVLAALEALSYLSHGVARVEPDEVSVSGATSDVEAGTMISGRLSEMLGEGARFTIRVQYVEALDPEAGRPTSEECEARIAAVQKEHKITFEPGSATLDASAAAIMDKIADILKECGEISLEIGGHTDSQGREEMNQRLSLARAQAVVSALRMRRVAHASLRAVGYGESRPIADNDTEEGREANRRIEFKVIGTDSGENGDKEAGDSEAGDSEAGDSGAGDSGAGDSGAGDAGAGDAGADSAGADTGGAAQAGLASAGQSAQERAAAESAQTPEARPAAEDAGSADGQRQQGTADEQD